MPRPLPLSSLSEKGLTPVCPFFIGFLLHDSHEHEKRGGPREEDTLKRLEKLTDESV